MALTAQEDYRKIQAMTKLVPNGPEVRMRYTLESAKYKRVRFILLGAFWGGVFSLSFRSLAQDVLGSDWYDSFLSEYCTPWYVVGPIVAVVGIISIYYLSRLLVVGIELDRMERAVLRSGLRTFQETRRR